ncbi:(2Fe-2S)-binding protein [Pedobacter psychroterrae]|uniref:(2Fe-2S)-binding protein n=1 Tax=Pedobacter psychroterrae TaxID=2530453 RepID=A0A4R0NHF8_9SPHI|nr:(2Fe-2S)-binding protein [Pedobacter psychroterrae]TCC99895.1 (2Fe-2S)-binding protein [Pedobacter psychroterrae]
MSNVVLNVNGQTHRLDIDPATPLLYVLRNQLYLNGPKFGCGMQQCGACMVLIDGKAQYSCTMPVSLAEKKLITTLEGLASTQGKLHPVQQSFLDEQAAQCGYCLNGMVISAVGLLNTSVHLDDAAIKKGMQRVLCRCGSQARVMRAIKRAIPTNKK